MIIVVAGRIFFLAPHPDRSGLTPKVELGTLDSAMPGSTFKMAIVLRKGASRTDGLLLQHRLLHNSSVNRIC